jgi:hypothetical protein
VPRKDEKTTDTKPVEFVDLTKESPTSESGASKPEKKKKKKSSFWNVFGGDKAE